jgi:hypothetical protein
MTVTFEICALGSLPWPKALGKLAEYPGLEHQMRLLLGEHWADPLTNQRAFEQPRIPHNPHRELAKAPFRC